MKMICALLISFMLLGCDKGEPETVIIPRNYTGYILVIYDQVNGEDPVYDNGRRVYKIPKSGILKTKLSPNPGWIGLPEFYYDKIASENRIIFKPSPRSLPKDSVVAHGGIAGSVKKSASGEEVIRFLEYYVGNKAQIDSAYERAQKVDIIKLIQ